MLNIFIQYLHMKTTTINSQYFYTFKKTTQRTKKDIICFFCARIIFPNQYKTKQNICTLLVHIQFITIIQYPSNFTLISPNSLSIASRKSYESQLLNDAKINKIGSFNYILNGILPIALFCFNMPFHSFLI